MELNIIQFNNNFRSFDLKSSINSANKSKAVAKLSAGGKEERGNRKYFWKNFKNIFDKFWEKFANNIWSF